MVCPDGRHNLDTSKELSLGFQCPGCMKGSFKDRHKAWKLHDHWVKAFQEAATKEAPKHTPGPSPPIPPEIPLPPATPLTAHAPVDSKVRNPGYPPVILRSRKDNETEGEVYGINLEVSKRELTEKLAPPGVPAQMALELSECLIDAVALPGKTGPTTKGDDAVTTMSLSLEAFSRMSRGEGTTGDTIKKDVKWAHTNCNALGKVKTEDKLQQMLHHVQSLRDGFLLHLISSQQTILSAECWDGMTRDAWCNSGYITTISLKAVDLYLALLNHLLKAAGKYAWDLVQTEIAHYLHKWNLIRRNSHLRVLAMCRIYVPLRDGAAAKWLTLEIESEKLGILYKDMLELKRQGGTVTREGVSLFLCPKCDTTLHGKDGCLWGSRGRHCGTWLPEL
jgi:hypothetical protein